MNRKEARKLVEITCVATFLFAAPLGYVNYREEIIGKWNTVYSKYFSVSDSEYEKYIIKQKEESKQLKLSLEQVEQENNSAKENDKTV